MADPRSAVSFQGLGYNAYTFLTDSTISYDATLAGGSAQVGLAVVVNGAGQVGLVADGEAVHGKVIKVESDDLATIQVEGVCELPAGASATVTAGKRVVGALGASSAKGYIRNATTGDELAAGDTVILNAAVTTAVVVDL